MTGSRVSTRSICFAAAVAALVSTGCGDSETNEPGYRDCWMSVDSLLATGIAVHDTLDARGAFAKYLECRARGDCRPGYPLRYVSSYYKWQWHAKDFWGYVYEDSVYGQGRWVRRPHLYVDETGLVVKPWPCI